MPSKITINLSDFNRGVYIYHVVDPNGKILESGKFQVSHNYFPLPYLLHLYNQNLRLLCIYPFPG